MLFNQKWYRGINQQKWYINHWKARYESLNHWSYNRNIKSFFQNRRLSTVSILAILQSTSINNRKRLEETRRNWNIVRNGLKRLPGTYPAPSKRFQARFPRVQYLYIYVVHTYKDRKRFQPFLTIQYSFCSFIFPCCEFISSCYPLWFDFPASDHPANKEASALPQCLEICLFIRSDKFLQEVHHQFG